MKLSQFENLVDPVILERGREYRANGRILSIDESRAGVFTAEVEGSELYEVTVQVDSRGSISYTSCNCPYDLDSVCKHTAAVLLELKDELPGTQDRKSPAGKKTSHRKEELPNQLAKLSKDELIQLLVGLSNEIREVEQTLALKFMETVGKNELEYYKKIIRAAIKEASDRHGFVSYQRVDDVGAHVYKIMTHVEEAAANEQYLDAAQICFCIMQEMVSLLQRCDDSGGTIGGIIRECLSLINHLADKLSDASVKDQSSFFKMLLKESQHKNLEGWDGWRLSLLESAIPVMGDPVQREEWGRLIDSLESIHESAHSTYFLEEAAQLRYQVIEKFEGEGSALAFLQSNLHMPAFRRMAIDQAIENREFDRALTLAEQGEQQDTAKRLRGLVKEWKKYRFEIYGLTGKTKLQIELAEEFVLSGEYAYYKRLKELTRENEWELALPALLDRFEANLRKDWNTASVYAKVLIEENQMQRLMNYVRGNKREVLNYYPYLVGEYAEEVYLFIYQIIIEETARSSNRNEYRKVCALIRQLIKAGGINQAQQAVTQIRSAYPNRPALIDELQKVKWN